MMGGGGLAVVQFTMEAKLICPVTVTVWGCSGHLRVHSLNLGTRITKGLTGSSDLLGHALSSGGSVCLPPPESAPDRRVCMLPSGSLRWLLRPAEHW